MFWTNKKFVYLLCIITNFCPKITYKTTLKGLQCDNFDICFRIGIVQNLDQQNMDCAKFGSCKIWIVPNLDRAEFGSCNIQIAQNLNCAKYGSCRIWIMQNLDHSIFRLYKFELCRIRIANIFLNFHFLRPNLHCGFSFLSGNADLFGLQ